MIRSLFFALLKAHIHLKIKVMRGEQNMNLLKYVNTIFANEKQMNSYIKSLEEMPLTDMMSELSNNGLTVSIENGHITSVQCLHNI